MRNIPSLSHLDASCVRRLNHLLELTERVAAAVSGGVGGVSGHRGEEAHRGVPPEVHAVLPRLRVRAAEAQ